jgi:hypothetical protein
MVSDSAGGLKRTVEEKSQNRDISQADGGFGNRLSESSGLILLL